MYEDVIGGAPERSPLNEAPQGNWPRFIADRNDAGVVPGERNDVLTMDKLPLLMSKEELTARRQQCVRFMPPSCGW